MKDYSRIPMKIVSNCKSIDDEVFYKYLNDYNMMQALFSDHLGKWNDDFVKAHPDMENYNCPEYNNYIARLYQNLIDTTIPSQRYIYYTVEPDIDCTVTCHVRATGEWLRFEIDVEKVNKMLGLA